MPKYLKTAFVRDLEKQVMEGELSYTRMLELIQDEVIKKYTLNFNTEECYHEGKYTYNKETFECHKCGLIVPNEYRFNTEEK